jgi:hypothetical protein
MDQKEFGGPEVAISFYLTVEGEWLCGRVHINDKITDHV